MKIKIKNSLYLDDSELQFDYIKSTGPGGQNVNKVSTAAQLRFNLKNSSALPEEIKLLLMQKLKSKLTSKGEIIITAKRYRHRERNKSEAVDRLIKLIQKALQKKKKRIPTKATKSSKAHRLKVKKKRGEIKTQRGKIRLPE